MVTTRPLEDTSKLDHGAKKSPQEKPDLFHQLAPDLETSARPGAMPGSRHNKGRSGPESGFLDIPSAYSASPELTLAHARPVDLHRTGADILKPAERKDKTKDTADIPLSSEAKEAKGEFIKVLEARFAGDPTTLERLKSEVLPRMEQDILHRDVKTKGNRAPIDMQQELAQSYRDLTRLGGGEAELLTYRDKAGVERFRYSKEDVDRLLVDGIVRESDRKHMFNQGGRNVCAAESISRVDALLPASYFGHLADLCTKGEVQLPDMRGGTYMCRPDAASLRIDQEGQKPYWEPENHRGAAGVMDVLVAQYNLDLMSMDKGSPPGRFVYTQEMNPRGQSKTGEHVYDRLLGREIANNPLLSSKRVSNVMQGLVGHRIADDFGKRMTMVSAEAYGNPSNVTTITNGDQIGRHLRENQDMGWQYAVVGTHTGNYWDNARGLAGSGGRRGGWHATGAELNDDGTVAFVNNWGKLCRPEHISTDTLASWMKAPQNASAIDQQRRDHILGPDQRFGHRDPFERNDLAQAERSKPTDKEEESGKDKFKSADVQQRVDALSAQLGQFRERLAALAEEDPRRNNIKALLADAEVKLAGTMQELPRV